MLLVSFCDIVTITICAMFMAMIVVIDESMKIPVVTPVPIVHHTTNAPVFFECRANKIFPIDLSELKTIFIKTSQDYKKLAGATDAQKIAALDAGNETYRLDPGLAMMGMLGLNPRPGAKGIAYEQIFNDQDNAYVANNPFKALLLSLNPHSQYCVFFVRRDGINIFRKCRSTIVENGYRHGFEIITKDEPITFEGLMGNVGWQ